jgi:hypothetical protein
MGFSLKNIFSGLSIHHLEGMALSQLSAYLVANKAELVAQADGLAGTNGDKLTSLITVALGHLSGPWALVAAGVEQLIAPYIAGLVASGEADLPTLFDRLIAAINNEVKALG